MTGAVAAPVKTGDALGANNPSAVVARVVSAVIAVVLEAMDPGRRWTWPESAARPIAPAAATPRGAMWAAVVSSAAPPAAPGGVCHVAVVPVTAIGTCPTLGVPESTTLPSPPPLPPAPVTVPVKVTGPVKVSEPVQVLFEAKVEGDAHTGPTGAGLPGRPDSSPAGYPIYGSKYVVGTQPVSPIDGSWSGIA